MIEPARANHTPAPAPPPDIFGMARAHPGAMAASHAPSGTPWGHRAPKVLTLEGSLG